MDNSQNYLGELALIHGATGASGLAAVQIASALGKYVRSVFLSFVISTFNVKIVSIFFRKHSRYFI